MSPPIGLRYPLGPLSAWVKLDVWQQQAVPQMQKDNVGHRIGFVRKSSWQTNSKRIARSSMIVPFSVTCAAVAGNLRIARQTVQTVVKMPAQTVLHWIHTLLHTSVNAGFSEIVGVGHTELRGDWARGSGAIDDTLSKTACQTEAGKANKKGN